MTADKKKMCLVLPNPCMFLGAVTPIHMSLGLSSPYVSGALLAICMGPSSPYVSVALGVVQLMPLARTRRMELAGKGLQGRVAIQRGQDIITSPEGECRMYIIEPHTSKYYPDARNN